MSDAPREASAATVKTSFALPIAGAFLRGTVPVPAGQTTLTQLLPVIQSFESAITGRVAEEAESAGKPISCRAGCGACCRQMVPVNIFEAEALTDWMHSLPEEQQAALGQRFQHALGALRDAGVIEKILDNEHEIEPDPMTQLAIDYFHAGVACPFLENESCSIHPIRPLACREYLVVSPPELCDDPAINPVVGINLPLKLSRVMLAFGRELTHEPRGWIPLVFLLAWGRGGQRPGELVAGTGEEVLKKFLEKTAEVAEAEKE